MESILDLEFADESRAILNALHRGFHIKFDDLDGAYKAYKIGQNLVLVEVNEFVPAWKWIRN